MKSKPNYLARLEQILQPLRKLAKADLQSKLVKANASVKQMERQLIQIQKAIQK